MAITGNIGEWSEIYTLLKALGNKKLFSGNEDIEKIEDLFYPIIKVLRTEANGNFEYIIDKNLVLINADGKKLLSLPVIEFSQKATETLQAIKEHIQKNKEKKKRKEKPDSTFSIPEIEKFMNEIHCSSLKASSNAKTDITIVIHDHRTNSTPELGFSIKSQLGGASTLFNAGKTTNIRFKVNNITDTEVALINNISTIKKVVDRVNKIEELGGVLSFDKLSNSILTNNLVLIDSLLPNIVAEMVYKYFSTKNSKVSDIVEAIEIENPLGFDKTNAHLFYTYKVKKLLTDAALGMVPSKVWTGQYDATGGYLLVKDDGELLCYHLYNRNEFEQYLFANTKLDTASCSRYGFGSIYKEDGQTYFNLNLQIRFIK